MITLCLVTSCRVVSCRGRHIECLREWNQSGNYMFDAALFGTFIDTFWFAFHSYGSWRGSLNRTTGHQIILNSMTVTILLSFRTFSYKRLPNMPVGFDRTALFASALRN